MRKRMCTDKAWSTVPYTQRFVRQALF